MKQKNWQDRFGGAALITGASTGLGETFADRLGAKGMDLVLVARRKPELEMVAEAIRKKYGVKVETLVQDLKEADSADQILAKVKGLGISIGLLVNNAGFGTYGRFDELAPYSEAEMVDVNCRAPVALTSRFLPDMVSRKKGGIIFLASVAAYQPTPFFATYGATKGFNLLFGEALWAELRGTGVEVISLSPGYTKTSFQERAGVHSPNAIAGWSKPEDVVDKCLDKLGKTPSTIPGFLNQLVAQSMRITPRPLAALIAYGVSKP
ncbi:oxidoreductase [Leptospira perolatii]|uniref:Oxidoreductase n=1 Tax=Leptospira perolatii TaxID=2023191 RepID=A0A2M9ZIJ3_9LEPT|nr:SDR family oxidoreductase [Leptospira perolatii]PJZ68343.1 oxidoreductase [Leptospira perolatii]PJZ71831.1 oxidoreductase [Leptospira perolatii]